MDGQVIIGTKLDTKSFDKEIAQLENKLAKLEKTAENEAIIETKVDENGIDKGIANIKAKMEKLRKKAEEPIEIDGVKVTGTWNLTEKEQNYYDRLQTSLTKLEQQKSEMLDKDRQIADATRSQATNEESAASSTNQWVDGVMTLSDGTRLVKKDMEGIDEAAKKIDLSNIEQQLGGIGKSIQNVTKKVVKWGLAIFGVRSAYMFIRQSMSTLSQYDEKLATDIEYIRYALANSLKPVIEGIINLVYKLLAYISYIAKAWFGVSLFANASAKAFKKQKDALGGSAKKAKELQKTMAGFDEMNVVQDTSDTSGGAGGGGALPSMDLGNIADIPIPGWIKWLADNGAFVAGVIAGIATALTLLKFNLDPIIALGIGAIVMGVVFLVQDIIDMINDPSWQNFAAILGDIAVIIGGIMLLMGNWLGLLVVIVGVAIKLIAENWDSIKKILGEVWGWIMDHIVTPIYNMFKPFFDFFINLFTTIWKNVKTIVMNFVEPFKSVFNLIKQVFSPIVEWFGSIWNKVKDKLKAFAVKVGDTISSVFKGVINAMLKSIESFMNTPIKAVNALIKAVNKLPGVSLSKLTEFKFPRLAKGGIINQPGSGIMLGGAVGGERGAEGVIPLTDSQQMALIGEAIGRYVTVNAQLNNYMNGRLISRELQKVQNDSDFAYNR